MTNYPDSNDLPAYTDGITIGLVMVFAFLSAGRCSCYLDKLSPGLIVCYFIQNRNRAMRILKLQVQMTVDGFIAGPNGEMDWMKFPWTEDIKEYVREITNPVETILLGKNLAQGFIPYWENVAKNPDDPEYDGGIKYSKTPKVVFTKILDESIWSNTVLATGELVNEVNALKNQNGGDLIVYGGATFVSALIK